MDCVFREVVRKRDILSFLHDELARVGIRSSLFFRLNTTFSIGRTVHYLNLFWTSNRSVWDL